MKSLDKRRDSRSIEVFANNIKDFTEREFYWGVALRIDFCERGAECSVKEHGVDNDGNLILNRLPNHNVDKIFHFKNGKNLHIEIKTIPEYVKNFFTFKVVSLYSCLDQNANILVPRSDCYYLIKNKILSSLLKNYEHKIYPKFSSNDMAIRIDMIDIENMITNKQIVKNQWMNKAKIYIKDKYKILFRTKN